MLNKGSGYDVYQTDSPRKGPSIITVINFHSAVLSLPAYLMANHWSRIMSLNNTSNINILSTWNCIQSMSIHNPLHTVLKQVLTKNYQ